MFRQKTPGEVDHALKILFRQVAPAVFRLVGAPVSAERIRPTDVTVNLPEFQADEVFLVGSEDESGRWALHLEYQWQPDRRVLEGWFLKNAALTARLTPRDSGRSLSPARSATPVPGLLPLRGGGVADRILFPLRSALGAE
ncbi:MAG: hypothetical protein C4321_07800 [Chloroflexota bacterium]